MISFSQSPGECGAFCECFAQVVWSLYRVFGGLRYRPATLGSLWHVSRTGQAALARGSMVEKQLKQDFPRWKLKRNDFFGCHSASCSQFFHCFLWLQGKKVESLLLRFSFFGNIWLSMDTNSQELLPWEMQLENFKKHEVRTYCLRKKKRGPLRFLKMLLRETNSSHTPWFDLKICICLVMSFP